MENSSSEWSKFTAAGQPPEPGQPHLQAIIFNKNYTSIVSANKNYSSIEDKAVTGRQQLVQTQAARSMGKGPDRISTAADSDEIDLVELFSDLWAQRWLIVAFVAFGLAVSVFYLQRATYLYSAELKVVPAQPAQSGPASKLGSLAGLASMAGVRMSQDPGTMSFLLYAKGIGSRSVAEALSRKPELMKVIFHSEWDEHTQRFVESRPGFAGSAVRAVKSFLGFPVYGWEKPDAARLQDYIKRNVKLIEDTNSPIVTLTYAHKDPKFAARFLTEIHRVLDSSIREKAHLRATQYINYLSKQLQSASLIEHRNTLAQVLSEQEKNRMMASSTLAFAAEPLDPATTSLQPISPNPLLVLTLGFVLSAAFGVGTALIRLQVSNYRTCTHPPEVPPNGA